MEFSNQFFLYLWNQDCFWHIWWNPISRNKTFIKMHYGKDVFTRKYAKLLFKFFQNSEYKENISTLLQYILKNVKKVVYIDCDVLIINDLTDIWRQFELMNSSQFCGLAPEVYDPFINIYKWSNKVPHPQPAGLRAWRMSKLNNVPFPLLISMHAWLSIGVQNIWFWQETVFFYAKHTDIWNYCWRNYKHVTHDKKRCILVRQKIDYGILMAGFTKKVNLRLKH